MREIFVQEIPAQIKSLRWLTPTILEICLTRPDGRPFFPINLGQYVAVSWPDRRHLKGYRPYSIVNAPSQQNELRLGIRVQGSYTRHLRNVASLERVMVYGPYGGLEFNPDKNGRAVFLAGGIGITPFLGVFAMAAEEGLENGITLLFSNRTRAETPYQAELRDYARRNPNFQKFLFLSDDKVPEQSEFIAGRITADEISRLVGDITDTKFYVCGPANFMKAMARNLRRLGVRQEAIHTEAFSVSPSTFIEPGPVPRFVIAGSVALAAIMIGAVVKMEQQRRQSSYNAATVENVDSSTSNSNVSANMDNGELTNVSENQNPPADNIIRPRTTVS